MRSLTFFFVLIYFATYSQVPSKLIFSGVTLSLDKVARSKVQAKISSLQKNQHYFNLYLQRCLVYFPVIEIALAERSIPDDFKYLALQESALIGDAVSRSNAVGYWQFKKITGLEQGLQIDYQVDERKNILSASIAAAAYLSRHHRLIKNWILTLLSYNMGLQGALRSPEAQQIRAKTFKVNKHTHMYIIHFLAHRLAFKKAYEKAKPAEVLMIYPGSGGKNLNQIAADIQVSTSRLLPYNKWILAHRIPKNKPYNFIVPVKNDELKRLTKHGLLPIEAQKVVEEINSNPKLSSSDKQVLNKPFKIIQNRSPNNIFKQVNNLDAVITGNNPNLIQILQQAEIKQRKFLIFNDINLQDPIKINQVYYLERKKNKFEGQEFHYLQHGESLWDVAQYYGLKLKKIKRLNRIIAGEKIEVGRKLHLKKRRKRKEKIEVKNMPTPKSKVTEVKSPQDKKIIVIPAKGEVLKITSKAKKKDTDANLKDYNFHSVKEGETVFSICKTYKIDVLELKRLNNLPDNLSLKEGQILILRKDTVGEAIENPLAKTILIDESGKVKQIHSDSLAIDQKSQVTQTKKRSEYSNMAKTYFPSKNESLEDIAKRYNIDVQKLKAWNKIDDPAKPVQKTIYLTKPKKAKSKKKIKKTSKPVAKVIKDSKNTVDLATTDKTTADSVETNVKKPLKKTAPTAANEEVLVKPNPPEISSEVQKQTYHIITKGQTLYKVARMNNLTVNDLKNWNNLTDNIISIGDTLWTEPYFKTPPKPKTHLVKVGETIYDIASMYGLTVTKLRQINQLLPSDDLQVGQNISLGLALQAPRPKVQENSAVVETSKPQATKQLRKHKVKSGETLYAIAKIYGISSQNLKMWNNLKSNAIKVGQELVVENTQTTAKTVKSTKPAVHIVQKGETLYSISKKYNISVQDLLRINQKISKNLGIGEKLKIKE